MLVGFFFFVYKWDFFQKIGPELTELRVLFPYRNKKKLLLFIFKKFHVTETLLECQVCGSVNTLNMTTTLRRIRFGKESFLDNISQYIVFCIYVR